MRRAVTRPTVCRRPRSRQRSARACPVRAIRRDHGGHGSDILDPRWSRVPGRIRPAGRRDAMANIREALQEKRRYSEFNREERNCVAMLYHALLLGRNLEKFLATVN